MFGFLKKSVSKIYSSISSGLNSLFARNMDESVIQDLKKILISADIGVKTTNLIIDRLQSLYSSGVILKGDDLKFHLKEVLRDILSKSFSVGDSRVFLMLGINGSGKTTFCGKLANSFSSEGKKVLLVAADTFRAAAVSQLEIWADKSSVDLYKGKDGQDPASVVFEACLKFKNEAYDYMIIDTAGRLQTKSNLMQELAKIKRVVERSLPDEKILTLLTLDSMLGQNSFEQAKVFSESTAVDGIVLTKLDGTGKGGFVLNVLNEFKIPVAYSSFGEKIEDFEKFNSDSYIKQLLDE